MHIHKLEKKDIQNIVKLHKEVVSTTNSKIYPQHVINAWLDQITVENVTGQLECSEWYLSKCDDRIVGFVQFSVDAGYLYQINVLPKFQNKGFGSNLFEFVEGEFRKAGKSEIKIYSTLNALGFYKKMGFLELGKIKYGYEPNKVDMVEMVKKLD